MNGIESAGFWAAVSVAFMQGFVGSLHCVGMCGPFVHLLNGRRDLPGSEDSESQDRTGRKNPRIAINLVYNLMRSLSYMSVGFFLGLAGKTINLYVVNSIAAILGALLLLYFGLSFLFPSSIPGFHGIRMPGWFNRSIGQLLRGRTNPVENAALMGMVSGLLPCGLLYPAYGLALGTGEPLAGAFTMFVFSLGTYPALMVIGLASSKLWDFLRARWPGRILGIAMILYAIFIVYKRWSHAGAF